MVRAAIVAAVLLLANSAGNASLTCPGYFDVGYFGTDVFDTGYFDETCVAGTGAGGKRRFGLGLGL